MSFALLLTAGTALAGEFWLEPVRFWIMPGTAVHLRRLTGTNFTGSPWSGGSSRLAGFWHYAPGQPAVSLLPAASVPDTIQSTVTMRQPGTHLLALTTNFAPATLPATDFTRYLRAYQLDYVLALREQRQQSEQPGREAYRRCAKTLVQAGPYAAADTARAWARPVGLPLELVPEQNPYGLQAGASLTVRVLAEGQPVAGQLVQVWQRSRPARAAPVKLHSNQNGRLLLPLLSPGEYLLSAVRMVPARADSTADWHSTWSTLTFAVAEKKRL
ncbi:DUF4198 domain-containing protein [Hymenobacter sp. NST-14]|uniref:DUF4198 domain-containing protein n=1 Tax=Hymenobacter piscis TaxID=2839984 RepID=UPI001C02FF49|nr:DUF4198 domain-containing protein [Hymenobacter piscis]MBT9393772.1 DUF4198 domain-containing protein [Hymenobacter piscis]